MPRFEDERFAARIRTVRAIKLDRDALRQFGRNLKEFMIDVWLDIIVLAILGAAAAVVWVAPHAFNRVFPVTFFETSGDIVWTQFAYPLVRPPLNSAAVGVVCALVPIASILVAQLWIQSFIDAANAILGLLYSLVTGTLFQVILKKVIGGLRPHFLTVCEPDISMVTGSGFRNVMFTVDQVCRGDKSKIKNAIESFPSGHSQIAWASMGYLAIYLFTHLRIQSQRRPSFWRMALVMTPVWFATYVASTLVLSYNHHGYDVIAGGLIGIIFALFSYRMVFMSIWDRRWNVVPRCRYREDPMATDDIFDFDPRKFSRDTVVNPPLQTDYLSDME